MDIPLQLLTMRLKVYLFYYQVRPLEENIL